ncbi:MAG: MotA/TolQ/ExbB proton channel family protein [Zoogloeaceae bacterium]|jgi:biopolymer transport protein ExbB/TolQ|nr:MotA/TolQ/ExbB proton channel family protein [Zoogloeaceae bacterium]
MELVPLIEHLLYEVATALYLPVIGGCALLICYVPLQLGVTLFDAGLRYRQHFPERERFRQQLDALRQKYQKHRQRLEIEVERLLQSEELELSRRLDRIRFVIKVGPALGLMGTLIPMGISLAALAEGNIPKMAGSMVTAFTATVAGLGSGVLAYLIALSRERWVRADVREMAHAAELVLTDPAKPHLHHLQEEAEDAIATAA